METPSAESVLSATAKFGSSPWLKTAAAAEYLGCTPGTLKTWRAAGAGPRYLGRHRFVRYHVEDLDNYVRNGGSRSLAERAL
jgi:hypothetical protein